MRLLRLSRRPASGPSRRAVLAATFGTCASAFIGCRRKPAAVQGQPLAPGATVLALGDSITYGTGAEPSASYPSQLASLTGWSVVNGGVPGDTAAQALERLPALLAEHQPALVIIGIGGNDFLRRLPVEATRDAVRRSATLVRDAGAQALLVAVPQPTLGAAISAKVGGTATLADHPLYDDIAAELKLPLHAGGWARVLGDGALRADAIHANAAGYRAFAEGLVDTLRRTGLLP